MEDLRFPLAFYVRLLDPDNEAIGSVEQFFRNTVDPVMDELAYRPHEVGLARPIAAFLNVEIFEAIHRAGLVVVDLTGARPNCLMELGYALGRRRKVVISAMKDTRLNFDTDKLPVFFWHDEEEPQACIERYREWIQRCIDMPPIVG